MKKLNAKRSFCFMHHIRRKVFVFITAVLAACFFPFQLWGEGLSAENDVSDYWKNHRTWIIDNFKNERPSSWGMSLNGVITRADTKDNLIALTLDACDGRAGGYDAELIDFLVENGIPATLFISGLWIDANKETFLTLASNQLFELGNHGVRHKPLSVTGRKAYGIKGTDDVGSVYDEVEENAQKIEALTGQRPLFFRSGTAHYDDVAVRVVYALGYKAAGFSVNGDLGGTAVASKVKEAILSMRSGEIILLHMNRPGSGTLSGLIQAVPLMKNLGFVFVKLSELVK